LILGKIIEFVATKCYILKLKCTQTALRELTALPDPLAVFKRPTSKRRRGGRTGGKGKGEGKGGEGRALSSVPPVPNLPLHHRL